MSSSEVNLKCGCQCIGGHVFLCFKHNKRVGKLRGTARRALIGKIRRALGLDPDGWPQT